MQNSNDTSGDVNVVAGWDGTSAFDATTFAAADVTSTALFGNSMGSVNIGRGTQAVGVAVGSRSGHTRVFGYDVALQGGMGAGPDGRFAQLGFQVSDGIAQDGTNLGTVPVVNGDITVHTTHNLTATGGSDSGLHRLQVSALPNCHTPENCDRDRSAGSSLTHERAAA